MHFPHPRPSALLLVLAVAVLLAASARPAAGDTFLNPYPESGRWFPDDGSRTGLFIEVQGGVLAGLYVGADGAGNNVWLSFSGPLAPRMANGVQVGWALESDLLQFIGGGCILDCSGPVAPPTPPAIDAVGTISLGFTGRSLATFTVDDGQPVAVRPIFFGIATVEDVPDLAGSWALALTDAASYPDHEAAGIVEIGAADVVDAPEQTPEPPGGYVYRTATFPVTEDRDDLLPPGAVIRCEFNSVPSKSRCLLVSGETPADATPIELEAISDSDMTVLRQETQSGAILRYRFFRLNHD
jgi:hypothetical protein